MFKLLRFAGVLAAMLVLVACAGPSEPAETVEPTDPPAPEPVEENVVMTEFLFTPAEMTVPAGADVTLTLPNEGSIVHSYYLMEAGYTAEAPFDDEDATHVLQEIEVQAGETGTLNFTAPTEAGTYQVVCHEPGHMEAGMIGSLVVTAP